MGNDEKRRLSDRFRPVDMLGHLSVRGSTIIDEAGRLVQLKGVSLFWSHWGERFYSDAWISYLATEWRAGVVRLAIAVDKEGYLGKPAQEMDKIKTCISSAIRNGIYVIIDWHSHFPYTIEAFDFFNQIAIEFGHLPNIIYEIWNEPGKIYTWQPAIRDHHEAVIGGIRARGAMGLVICGTPNFSNDIACAAAEPLTFENICYSVHFYSGTHRGPEREAIAAALDGGVAIFVSEYGLSESSGDGVIDVEEQRRWWRFLDERSISYVNWSLVDKAESCAALLPGADLSAPRGMRLSNSGRLVRSHMRRSSRRSVSAGPRRVDKLASP